MAGRSGGTNDLKGTGFRSELPGIQLSRTGEVQSAPPGRFELPSDFLIGRGSARPIGSDRRIEEESGNP